jgi:hypothetical protein
MVARGTNSRQYINCGTDFATPNQILDWSTTEGKQMDNTYKIVRTYSAGVFAGTLESRTGQEVVMTNARRLWYWEGAASLSQLAMEGVKSPKSCKFPCAVSRVELLEAIEILDVTPEARAIIEAVPIWSA